MENEIITLKTLLPFIKADTIDIRLVTSDDKKEQRIYVGDPSGCQELERYDDYLISSIDVQYIGTRSNNLLIQIKEGDYITKHEKICRLVNEDSSECATCRERKGFHRLIGGGCIANAIINGMNSDKPCSCWKPSRKILKRIGLI